MINKPGLARRVPTKYQLQPDMARIELSKKSNKFIQNRLKYGSLSLSLSNYLTDWKDWACMILSSNLATVPVPSSSSSSRVAILSKTK